MVGENQRVPLGSWQKLCTPLGGIPRLSSYGTVLPPLLRHSASFSPELFSDFFVTRRETSLSLLSESSPKNVLLGAAVIGFSPHSSRFHIRRSLLAQMRSACPRPGRYGHRVSLFVLQNPNIRNDLIAKRTSVLGLPPISGSRSVFPKPPFKEVSESHCAAAPADDSTKAAWESGNDS